jgi:chemotaxis signal transduction protein
VPLAFPLGRVREVILWVPWHPVPPDRPGLVGLLSLRGESCPVWDIRALWGWRPRQPDAETSLVLTIDAEGALSRALVVDRSGWVVESIPSRVVDQEDMSDMDARGSMFDYVVKDADADVYHFVVALDELAGQPEATSEET